jgi:uroporphyrin-III C-methyltransferase
MIDSSRHVDSGKVYLIGAGPGDLELLTLKAVRCIGEGDVILLDSLANPQVLQFAKPGAKVIKVGKRGGRHSVKQSDIESLMVEQATEGLTVCRIKGGDPLVFARGGEEIEALRRSNVPFEIIPGITAASGISASLGMSLTHRDLSHSVLYLNGPQFEPPAKNLTLPDLSNFAGTIIVYMGLKYARVVCTQLRLRGLSPNTPAVAVQSGTMPEERTVFSSIEQLPESIAQAGLESPVLLIVGEVVTLSQKQTGNKLAALSGGY